MAGSIFASGLDAVNNAVKAAWLNSFSEAQNNLPYGGLTTDMGKSTTKNRQLDWIGETPNMQDVTNDRLRVGGMRRFNYTIEHKLYKAALRIPIADLETDDLSQIQPRINGLARKASGHPGRLAFDQLEGTTTAFDGTALFANTRTYGASANIDNIVTGSGTGASNIESDLASVRSTMLRFEDDNGDAMELAPNTLVIPPELGLAFAKVLGGTRDPGGTTTQLAATAPNLGNMWSAGGYTVIELARLSDTDNWYALHTGEELNPFVFSWISMPQVMNAPSMNDASAVNDDMLIYVVRGHYNVGVSLPHYFVEVAQ